MVDPEYIPDCGQLDPQRWHEQAGKRPFLVLSPRSYNAKASLVVGVPIASQEKGYPFEVLIRSKGKRKGVALVDQIKSLDWKARSAALETEVNPEVLHTVRTLLSTFISL